MAAVTAILHSPAASVTWAANQQQGTVCYSPVWDGEWGGKSRGSGVEEKCSSKKDGVASWCRGFVRNRARTYTWDCARVCVGKKAADKPSWLTDSFLIEISGRWSAVPHAHTRSHRDGGGRPASRASSLTAQQRLFFFFVRCSARRGSAECCITFLLMEEWAEKRVGSRWSFTPPLVALGWDGSPFEHFVYTVFSRTTGKILIAQRQTRYFVRNGCNIGSGGCKFIPVSFKDYLVC